MRVRCLPAACAAALLAACQPSGWESFQLERYRMDTEKPPVRRERDTTALVEIGDALVKETAVYLSAVVFPEGYDWVRDTSYREVEKTLVLLRNGVRVLSLPAGPGTEIGTDPDMHRIRDGQLYSDYSTVTETVVRRGGVELFRFAGREHFVSFHVWNGQVHTLGRRRDGNGFAYRVDGKVVYARERGVPVGRLHRDGEAVCFAFEDDACYFFVDGKLTQIPPPAGTRGTFDARRQDGEFQLALRSSQASGAPVLLLGEKRYTPYCPWHIAQVNRCRFAEGNERLLLNISCTSTDGERQDAVWGRDAPELSFAPGRKVFDSFFSGGSIGYLAATEERLFIRPPGGEERTLEGQYRFLSEACAWQEGKRLYAALTGVNGTPSVLWRNGEAETVPLWGYLTGVSVREELVPSSQ